jgi:hypothetical protein
MRILFLTALTAALVVVPKHAAAQDGATAGSPMAGRLAGVPAGIGIDDGLQPNNRVYVLPPEADVEVTGSVNPRRCVGDTIGRRICQEPTDEAAR